jgi:hypothetical protein
LTGWGSGSGWKPVEMSDGVRDERSLRVLPLSELSSVPVPLMYDEEPRECVRRRLRTPPVRERVVCEGVMSVPLYVEPEASVREASDRLSSVSAYVFVCVYVSEDAVYEGDPESAVVVNRAALRSDVPVGGRTEEVEAVCDPEPMLIVTLSVSARLSSVLVISVALVCE